MIYYVICYINRRQNVLINFCLSLQMKAELIFVNFKALNMWAVSENNKRRQ